MGSYSRRIRVYDYTSIPYLTSLLYTRYVLLTLYLYFELIHYLILPLDLYLASMGKARPKQQVSKVSKGKTRARQVARRSIDHPATRPQRFIDSYFSSSSSPNTSSSPSIIRGQSRITEYLSSSSASRPSNSPDSVQDTIKVINITSDFDRLIESPQFQRILTPLSSTPVSIIVCYSF